MISRIKVTLLTGAAALATAVVGTGMASGHSAHPSAAQPPPPPPPSSTAPGPQDMPSWHGHGRGCDHGGMMRGEGILGQIEHGEATLETAHGPEVMDLQRGTVQSVSSGQLSVRSADGFSATYVVDHSTQVRGNGDRGTRDITEVMANDQVIVLATKSDGTVTATRIIDIGQHATTNR